MANSHTEPNATVAAAVNNIYYPRRSYNHSTGYPSPSQAIDELKKSVSYNGCQETEILPEVECVVRARIPTTFGIDIFLHLYRNNFDEKEHLAFVYGDKIRSKSLDVDKPGETEMDRMVRGAYTGRLFPGRKKSGTRKLSAIASSQDAYMVRIHSECYTGETAWSARCDCGEQLDEAARIIAENKDGVIIYLRQEGRGIGLIDKLRAYNLQDLGDDTVEANLKLKHPSDARTYGVSTSILLDLGIDNIRLLTNNPDKISAIEGPNHEIKVKERIPMIPKIWRGELGVNGKEFENYLRTKVEKMGHLLSEGRSDF